MLAGHVGDDRAETIAWHTRHILNAYMEVSAVNPDSWIQLGDCHTLLVGYQWCDDNRFKWLQQIGLQDDKEGHAISRCAFRIEAYVVLPDYHRRQPSDQTPSVRTFSL